LGRNATKKYVAVLLDFESNQIVDIIYGRTKDALHSYFQRLPEEQLRKVEFISSDMYEGYRFLQRHYFKQAKLCVDSFHVIQLILSMMDAQLKGFLRHYDRGSLEYYLLKQKRIRVTSQRFKH
jgi:transposase